jgi:hypothetical protein
VALLLVEDPMFFKPFYSQKYTLSLAISDFFNVITLTGYNNATGEKLSSSSWTVTSQKILNRNYFT